MQFEILKSHEGLVILGATQDFRVFQEIIHDVNERSPIIEDKEGVFLGLAYDFRKAFEGTRVIRKPKRGEGLESTLVGFDILWPSILIQTRMLRVAMGFIDSTKQHQVLAYALEDIIEKALPQDFKSQSDLILEAYRQLDPAHPWLDAKASSRIEHWYKWNKATREEHFVELLESLDPVFAFHYESRISHGEFVFMSPAQWDASDDDGIDPSPTRRH